MSGHFLACSFRGSIDGPGYGGFKDGIDGPDDGGFNYSADDPSYHPSRLRCGA
jgi:hypothetical protein